MLTFISFWRAAAVVLNDLGASGFYAAGIAEQAIGKSAAWFMIGVMIFAFAVRAVYVESCTMFIRGGTYRIVKEALGGNFAKLSVSALMFDYILTGPISGVSAGQYVAGLINNLLSVGAQHSLLPGVLLASGNIARQVSVNFTSVTIAVVVTLYYWWQNVKGIEESSEKALNVFKLAVIMVVILLGWGIFSVIRERPALPPFPVPTNIHFSSNAFGFLKYLPMPETIGLFGIVMAFGHSVLAMSGEETLAQVNREIEAPKLKNLMRAAAIIAIFTVSFTGIGSLLAVMLVPDSVRVSVYGNNLMAGLAMYMVGPQAMRIALRIFVVVVGFLMLSGSINTSIIGANGVLMRVAEDGVMTDWFRRPHSRFGTSYRIINLIVIMELATILLSRGNVIALGEAYAFGVIWSFTFNSLSMLVLRWRYKGERGWKVPLNFHIGGTEIPLGLMSVFGVLVTVAIVNLFTKSIATVSGVVFAAVFFTIFTVSEKHNRRRHAVTAEQMKEHFQLEHEDKIKPEVLEIRPGSVMVTMRDAANPFALKWTLAHSDAEQQDIVVLTARMVGAGGGAYLDASEQMFSEYEQMLFTKAVSVAESFGKHISLLMVPAADIFSALVQTANSLEAAAVVAGRSSKLSVQEQAYYVGQAWEALPKPKRQITFYVVSPDGSVESFLIGPHAPHLQPDDVQLVHRLWLNFKRHPEMQNLHHSDIVTFALTRLASEYARNRDETLGELRRSLQSIQSGAAQQPSGPARPTLLGAPGYEYTIRAPKGEDENN